VPYISKPTRERLDRNAPARSLAQLSYVIVQRCIQDEDSPFLYDALVSECDAFLGDRVVTFEDFAGILGALDASRREYKRRRSDSYLRVDGIISDVAREFFSTVTVPYLETNIQTNGDIFS
jgi:hypothetical protein